MKSKANVMVLKAENQNEIRFDSLKWLFALFLMLAGMAGNYYYSEISVLIRMSLWLCVLALAGFVISRTQKGRWVLEFLRDSRMELRKVVWPTREETVQMTMIVSVMVVILALLLWGMDGIVLRLVGWLTGQHG